MMGAFLVLDTTDTGINEIEMSELIILYPNPGSGIFTVKSKEEISSIEVYNTLGEKIHLSEPKTKIYEFDLRSKAKGIYFVKINLENNIVTQKIIIQ